MRLKQVLVSQQSAVELYKLLHLFAYYDGVFAKDIGSCDLAQVCHDCRVHALTAFKKQIATEMEQMSDTAASYTADLSCSHQTIEKVHQMVCYIRIHGA